MKNYQAILLVIGGFGVAYSILFEIAQRYVHFEGIENEIGCAVIAGVLGVLGLIAIDYRKIIKALN